MPARVQQILLAAMRVAAPWEICGFILREWEVEPITNVSLSQHHFRMYDREVVELLSLRFPDVLGVYHSHPNGPEEPSEIDRELWMGALGWRYWLVTERSGVTEWDPGTWRRRV